MQNGLKCAWFPPLARSRNPTHAIIPTQPITCFTPRPCVAEPIRNEILVFGLLSINCTADSARDSQRKVLPPRAIWVLATLGWLLSNEDSQHCAGFHSPTTAPSRSEAVVTDVKPRAFCFTPNSLERQICADQLPASQDFLFPLVPLTSAGLSLRFTEKKKKKEHWRIKGETTTVLFFLTI